MKKVEHFNGPGVMGAFYAPWSPLGPTDKGRIFSIGFYLSEKNESSPQIMWIPKSGGETPIEVKSLASINAVARQITADQPPELARRATIEIARRLVAHAIVNKGSGGFSLDPEASNKPQWIIARLRKAGLSESDVAMLNELVEQARFTIGDKEWLRRWFEVDSLGSVEKITVTGLLEPPSVKSLQVETVFEVGKINVDILKKERALELDGSK
jgi:hypothetical protein